MPDGLGGAALLGEHPAEQGQDAGLCIGVGAGAGVGEGGLQGGRPVGEDPPDHERPLGHGDPPGPLGPVLGAGRSGDQGEVVALGGEPAERLLAAGEVPYGGRLLKVIGL
ncbi:hypothetical protein OG422_01640 [Streptomyces sp. NBC_01525]|uniref:hypothetical protein n=1 Tax=Streptomyces sp. NBC_01525 TaxID=2903893 RepID=UPI00386A557A